MAGDRRAGYAPKVRYEGRDDRGGYFLSDYVYRFVPFIPRLKVGVFGPENAGAISAQLEALVAQFAQAGWEFVRLEQVSVVHAAGCLASLFGAKNHTVDYDLVVFRVPAAEPARVATVPVATSRPPRAYLKYASDADQGPQ
jgi:hypothetical protein